MSINNPGSLFMPVNGMLVAKVYIAGLPNRTNIIKQVSLPDYYTIMYQLYLTIPAF